MIPGEQPYDATTLQDLQADFPPLISSKKRSFLSTYRAWSARAAMG